MKNNSFKDKLKSYFERCGEDTPPFFRKLKIVGLMVAAAGTTIVAAPITLPAIVTTVGGYLIVGGSVATAVSQAAIAEANDCDSEEGATISNQ